jgi:hypothetical protein
MLKFNILEMLIFKTSVNKIILIKTNRSKKQDEKKKKVYRKKIISSHRD